MEGKIGGGGWNSLLLTHHSTLYLLQNQGESD